MVFQDNCGADHEAVPLAATRQMASFWRVTDLDRSRLDRRHLSHSHQTSLPTGGPHSSSRWRFSGFMPATRCSKVYRRRRRLGLAISTMSLPSRTSILAALPTLAPISCANALGTRSARLLPHFKNLTDDRQAGTALCHYRIGSGSPLTKRKRVKARRAA
jgi:hypothetical protein